MTLSVRPREAQELWRALEAAEAAAPVDAVDAVTQELAVAFGTDRVAFLIADLAGRALVRMTHGHGAGLDGDRRDGTELAHRVPFESPRVARTLQDQQISVGQHGDEWQVLAPVSQRGEVIGLLEVIVTDPPDPDLVRLVERAARLLAYVVIANRRHTDLFEWAQRSAPFELSAELQRRLLPAAFTCEGTQFALSAWMEPAATIGGDTFDYTVSRDTLHLSVTDAMGHGLGAAVIASVAVGALRNGRRRGDPLTEEVAAANVAVAEHCDGGFCTGLVAEVDLVSGEMTIVNAGHLPPILLRDGTAREIHLRADLPIGIDPATVYRPHRLALRPGDRVAIVTDGMTERAAGQVDLPALIERTAHQHPREATRHLADGVIAVSPDGLPDDATVLLFDWYGGHGT